MIYESLPVEVRTSALKALARARWETRGVIPTDEVLLYAVLAEIYLPVFNLGVESELHAIAAVTPGPNTPSRQKPSSAQCCCRYGLSLRDEWPEFECYRCPKHHGAFATPTEMCKRHTKEYQP